MILERSTFMWRVLLCMHGERDVEAAQRRTDRGDLRRNGVRQGSRTHDQGL